MAQAVPSPYLKTNFQSNSNGKDGIEKTPKGVEMGYQYPKPSSEEAHNNEITVNKNVYFYKAPNDFEISPTRKPIKLPTPRKNYKIIFIKAPSSPSLPPVVQLAPQNEDKTLVYVLVKKPEEQPDIVIPTPPPTKASKPEVYFVNYQTRTEQTQKSEQSYGIPQYGRGYYYPPESVNQSDEAKDKSTDGMEQPVEEDDGDKNNQTDKPDKKRAIDGRNYFRGIRSSAIDNDLSGYEQKESRIYYSRPQPRSRAFH